MKSLDIQYDKSKNAANKLKHKGVSLAETEPVFHDERALTIEDNDHDEQRWITYWPQRQRALVGRCVQLPRRECRTNHFCPCRHTERT
jgi:uncharacterized DUF497 family protein